MNGKGKHCTRCGKPIEPNWNSCPFCSLVISRGLSVDKVLNAGRCPECGSEVERSKGKFHLAATDRPRRSWECRDCGHRVTSVEVFVYDDPNHMEQVFDAQHGNIGTPTAGGGVGRIQELITLLGAQTDQSGQPLHLQPSSILAGTDQMFDFESTCIALMPDYQGADSELFS